MRFESRLQLADMASCLHFAYYLERRIHHIAPEMHEAYRAVPAPKCSQPFPDHVVVLEYETP